MATPRITEGMFFNTKVGFILMGGVVWATGSDWQRWGEMLPASAWQRLVDEDWGDASCVSMTRVGGQSLGVFDRLRLTW